MTVKVKNRAVVSSGGNRGGSASKALIQFSNRVKGIVLWGEKDIRETKQNEMEIMKDT